MTMQQAYDLGAKRVRQPHWPPGATLKLTKILRKDGTLGIEAFATGPWKELVFALGFIDAKGWVPCTEAGQILGLA